MLSILKRFFDFCSEEDRKKFYQSILLGVLKSFIIALRIPAIALVILAIIQNNLSMSTVWFSLGIMASSVLLNTLITLKITMLQTEAGYHTCAQKRIELQNIFAIFLWAILILIVWERLLVLQPIH